MMAELQDKVNELARQFSVPSDLKLDRRLQRLERMAKFYESKIEQAEPRQANMFKGFISSLLYAMTMIKMYRKLTKALAELAEEESDDRVQTTEA